ncbi:intermembrane lipid transfer protein VPS13B [Cydia fagiglandana]|uniref:intermembrane lipid transfer protein VPS13B n=1 Tax=Cydia fagiglandana TaxID=1458189 RepID=UPI002FEDF39E
MFKIESYVTPILLSYVDKYVRDFKPADAQVSLWGGGVALHNLVLKADVLQNEVALPFTLVSGRIHELLIQVPWTKIMSEPIVVTIDTIECVLSLHPPAASEETLPTESPRSTVVEAPPGYMQALVRRIVSNISLRVHHLIVKYVQDDIVLSLNVKHLCVESAGADWAPAFADIDQSQPVVRRLMRLDDLTLCLDRADSDGKIRFYQEPLLYRCQLDFRILTRLVSANTRRASCLTVQLRSSKLAWGVTSEQLTLLLRLLRERQNHVNISPPPPKQNAMNSVAPQGSLTSNVAEPVRSGSWSEWAWSWLPTWMDKEGGVEEATMPPTPIPVLFSAYLDHVSLVFKVMEAEGSARKRARGVIELSAYHAAARAALCAPTTLRVRVGVRQLRLLSRGKCICGHQNLNTINDEPTIYLEKRNSEDDKVPWGWPDNFETLECKVETAEAAEEVYSETSDPTESAELKLSSIEEDDATDELWRALSPVILLRYSHTRSPPDDTNPYESPPVDFQYRTTDELWRALSPVILLRYSHTRSPPDDTNPYEIPPSHRVGWKRTTDELWRALSPVILLRYSHTRSPPDDTNPYENPPVDFQYRTDELWRALSPVILLRYSHTRSPPDDTNPYESPPVDFQYSDWQEENKLKIILEPMDIYLGMGLLHRISAIQQIFKDLPSIPVPDVPMRTLTVEECEALDANIPQRRTFLVMRGLRLRVLPWDHSPSEKQTSPSLVLDVESPEVKLIVSGPLYPHRVCSAACQMPRDEGPLWQGARLHVTATLAAVEAHLCRLADGQSRPVARADLRLVLHLLLHPEMFAKKETVHTSYNLNIREMNTCGSAARLQAAWHVLHSLIDQRPSHVLRHTLLVRDALSDEESVAIDATMEEASLRGFITRTVTTHIAMVQAARVMAFYSPNEGNVKQAWIFSAPDSQTTTAFVRVALQWCAEQSQDTVDYLGVWTEPLGFCADPLFIAWLAYKPLNKSPTTILDAAPVSRASSSSHSYLRRRLTPPSSSGRGASRTASGSELVHAARLRSLSSSSEHGETRRPAPPPPAKTPETFLNPDRLLKLHARLQKLLVCVELGTAVVYFTTGTASAEGCAAMRDAVERLAAGLPKQQVLVLSMGRLTVSSNSMMSHLWDTVRNDGPTFITKPTTEEPMESFPWKLRLADVTCYTLELRQYTDAGRVQGGVRRSTLKASPISTRLVLEAVTTTVTLSVVTKYMQIRSWKVSPEQQKSTERSEPTPDELRVKYFKSGIDFKPSTLKEFVRGPSRLQRNKSPERKQSNPRDRDPKEKTTQGPVVSMGVHLHADTPPVTVRLDHDQEKTTQGPVVSMGVHLHADTPPVTVRLDHDQEKTTQGPVVSMGVHLHADTPPVTVRLDHDQEKTTQGPVVSMGVHLHADTPPVTVRLDHDQEKTTQGPVVSMGVHLHADTPPVTVRLDHDQEKTTQGPVVSMGVHLHADTPPVTVRLDHDQEKTTQGPVVSMGVHLHADTPPVTVRLDHDQVNIVAAAVHCLKHLHMVMSRTSVPVSRSYTSLPGSHDHRSLVRSVSELNEQDTPSDENMSESYSELVPIFECRAIPEVKLKTFFWFQWVVGRATLVVATHQSKLAMEIDDIISTVDIQEHYNQLKVKVASASVRHHKRSHEDWEAGVLGGRVLVAREPIDSKEEDHFLAVTITQAQISNLPASWKEELHPKLLQQKGAGDSMWEIYATLAPLEAVLQPSLIENIMSLVREMAPPSFCPLQSEDEPSDGSSWQWPFCYVTAGGLRLLVSTDVHDPENDDTFLLLVGKVSINPHPENPICRQSVTTGLDGSWTSNGGSPEGRQYEVNVKHVAIQSAQLQQIIKQEEAREIYNKGTGSENPAVKWSQPPVSPVVTAILHHVDISCILAPPLFVNGALSCGPAVELNLASDCAFEISLEQLKLVQYLFSEASSSKSSSEDSLPSTVPTAAVCPYAALFLNPKQTPESTLQDSNPTLFKGVAEMIDESSNTGKSDRGFTTDSGIDVATSTSRLKLDRPPSKKNLNVAFAEEIIDVSEHLEVFVTMGEIEISLYMEDDNSPAAIYLRPHPKPEQYTEEDSADSEKDADQVEGTSASELKSTASQLSITHGVRLMDSKIDMHAPAALHLPRARLTSGKLPLLHITLHQPNLYYWRKKTRKNLQVSLFNAWIGLGAGEKDGSQPLLSTAKGTPDPVTDIPPALATLKIVTPTGGSGPSNYSGVKGSATVDVERPVLLGLSADTLRRLTLINRLVQEKLQKNSKKGSITLSHVEHHTPPFLKLRKLMASHNLENIVIQMSQLGVSGSEGTIGWDSASLQIGAAARPERLVARALVSALLVAAGPPGDQRHVLLQPMMLGMELECSWEAWRRAEDGVSAREPSVRVTVDLDRVTLDVRPEDLAALRRVQLAINTLKTVYQEDETDLLELQEESSVFMRSYSTRSMSDRALPTLESVEAFDQHYKDDLKSGAFKIVTGGQFPMAYQVTLHGDAMSWRYPHPRTVSRITVFPIPGIDEEVKCKLEFYDPLLKRWEPHTYVTLPVSEPNEIKLYAEPPDAVFATLWRFCADSETKPQERTFEFDITKFMPRVDPLASGRDEPPAEARVGLVSAEQLSSALRVDSYFSPRSVARVRVALRCTELELHAHNSLPSLSRKARSLEGYYVSRPLMRSHRVLCVSAADTVAQALLGSRAGRVLLLDTKLSCDVLDCSTGTLEQMVGSTRVQASASVPSNVAVSQARVRACSECVRVALHVPRLSTLRALANDWGPILRQCKGDVSTENEEKDLDSCNDSEEDMSVVLELEGRVSLWVHNSCCSALRVGQEGCEEIAPLGPGARLAYRWPSPNAPFKIRFALAGPSTEWSSSIPFSSGESRVRLPDAEAAVAAGGVFVHVRGDVAGARRTLHLSGRLVLANALRRPLHYKVRAKNAGSKAWCSVCSGELHAETVGRSVLCGVDCEMVLKIKFTTQDTGWSGDIPLKECPKENVPWLVKVPSEGETAYVSVWCRVVRARSDGRVLAAIWPLYVLCSHLPLDTDVLVTTQIETSEPAPSPLVQTAPGRGACTHLLAPGTTAARHQLSFQYKDVEHPVTREAIPLHYGVTDTSVFDKRAPVNNINEIVEEIREWFDRSARRATSDWPYSIVASHWSGPWSPAKLQPRCDVTVRYDAVRAGGGCSLQISLRPVALLCNAARVPLTLRAHDAAPLCRLEPGAAVSAPSALMQKPFFMSVEMGRETFVSGQLQVWGEEPGRYGSPPRGCVALDHPAPFLIHCKQKVAFLTLHYEIKEEINVLGVTSTFLLINRLETNLLVSGIAVPVTNSDDVNLQPKNYKVVSPTNEGSLDGEALSRFWVLERWRGGDPSELRTYLCLALPARGADAAEPAQGEDPAKPAHAHVPVLLAAAPVRRAVALRDHAGRSIPAVVVQQKHEGRWVVTVAPDPCPQFVVHNHSSHALLIAQPDLAGPAKTVAECPGTRWHCAVEAGGVVHYSTPAHSARFPPPPNAAPNTDLIPFLTIGKLNEHKDPEWSEGVAAAGGEQLVQLPDSDTVKLRVRPHPHSSLLELKDVDENDISASVIRRRLEGSFCADTDTGNEVNIIRSVASSQLTAPTQTKLARVPVVSTNFSTAPANTSEQEGKNLTSANDNLEPGLETKEILNLQKYDESTSTTCKLEKVNETIKLLDDEKEDSGVMLKTEPTFRSENSMVTIANVRSYEESAKVLRSISESEWVDKGWSSVERVRCVVAGIAIEMAATPDVSPLLALHIDRAALSVQCDSTGTKAVVSIADIQVDNLQYESGNYDFAVVASTRGEPPASDAWPPLWPGAAGDAFALRENEARLMLRLCYDSWTVIDAAYKELTEVELRLGPLALYVEDGYVGALVRLARAARPAGPAPAPGAFVAAETRALQRPLRLRSLHLHPLDLTLTLHTAVRMYIALDQSPLCLSAFQQTDMVTCAERLTHALTVHYLSAAILGAGWVVGGLELLGAPGALAARVGGARGGVRGVAAAAAAALLRSLSACAGSLARNLDLLAGDDDHARRAAAARRRHPDTFVQGLAAGITNFAINILGAVGGLAHHPLVSVAVGEVEGSAAALRRGLVGALTKPLSATADLVAFAGHGLLRQTGWDPVPQRRSLCAGLESGGCGWRRDCVRWSFRLAEAHALAGFDVLLDDAPLRLLLTHKYLMITDPDTERIVEMVDLRFCTLRPHQGPIVELVVTRRQKEKVAESKSVDEDDEYQVSSAAMARVARYTGADGGVAPAPGAARVLALQPAARHAPALRAALTAALHAVSDDHLHLL